MDPDSALQICDELLEDLQDLPEAAEEFAESVHEKVRDVQEWIEARDFVTHGQEFLLRRLRRGVDKWLCDE